MSKSKKGARGKTVDLASFVGNAPDNSLDWACDEFAPTPPVRPQEGGEVPPLDGKKSNRTFGFKAGSMGGNFREEEAIQLSTVVPLDMVAPFVAYVGNLPHNIAGSVVEEQFVGVTSVRVIKHDKSTFAYVEFDSRDDLQNAIYCTGKMVGGRKIKVDVASDAQRERLVDERNRGANSPAGDAFAGGRDGMGTAQPRRGMGSRNPSSNDVSFSRDNMGAAQPSSNDLGTPTTSGSPLPDFSRAVFGAVQQKSPNSAGGRANFRERSSKPASPVVSGTPNFRDGPQAAQPDLADWRTSEKAEQPATPVVPAATFARRGESDQKETKTSDEPKKTTPTETKKPAAENPWRRGPPAEASKGDDRFAALRS